MKLFKTILLLSLFITPNLFAQEKYPVGRDITQILLEKLTGDLPKYNSLRQKINGGQFELSFENNGKEFIVPNLDEDTWSQGFVMNWIYYTSLELDADLAKKEKPTKLKVRFDHDALFSQAVGIKAPANFYLVVTIKP